MKTNERAQEALNRILEMFKSNKLPVSIARTMIQPVETGKPCDKWSLGNKILMVLAGTADGRGFKAWQKVGRKVKKGAKAFYILAPNTRKITNDAEEERTIISGFRFIPAFRLEDTEGDSLPEISYDPLTPPPLQDVAKAFGVDEIVYTPGYDSGRNGFFGKREQGKSVIVLHTHDVRTWFHELGHAVHDTFHPLENGQVAGQEIVAELFAATMCELYGIQGCHGYSWDYVKAYSSKDPNKALKSIFKVLADVEECLKRVFAVAGEMELAS